MEIDEIDFKSAWEECRELPFEEQISFLISLIVRTTKNIALVARAYADLQTKMGADAEQLKSIVKGVEGVSIALATDHVVVDILKGGTRSMEDKEFWRKERDKIKSMTEGWYII